MKKYVLLVLVALVVALSAVQSFQINAMKNEISSLKSGAVSSGAVSSGGVNMQGWTENEKMMYEHHGTLPARIQSGQQQNQMVGGC